MRPVGAAAPLMSEERAHLILLLDWSDYSGNREYIFELPCEVLRRPAEAHRQKYYQERISAQFRKNFLEQINAWRK